MALAPAAPLIPTLSPQAEREQGRDDRICQSESKSVVLKGLLEMEHAGSSISVSSLRTQGLITIGVRDFEQFRPD
jgi:hypothetical protein